MSSTTSTFQLVSGGKTVQVDPTQTQYLKAADGPGLDWTASAIGTAGEIQLCTTYQNSPYCLDILNDDAFASPSRTKPLLAKPAVLTGQMWSQNQLSDGSFRLSNEFTGAGWYLDVNTTNGIVLMNNATDPGTSWSSKGSGGIGTSSTSSTASASTTSATISSSSTLGSTATITSTSSSTATTSSTSSSTGSFSNVPVSASPSPGLSKSSDTSTAGLSDGAKAGIGAGVGIAVLSVIAALLAFWLLRRRKRREQWISQPMWLDEKRQDEQGARVSTASHNKVELTADVCRYEMDGIATAPQELASHRPSVKEDPSELPSS